MPVKYNTEDFIKISNNVHKNKYDYSLVNYVNNSTKVKIICPKHGKFEQRPDVHFRGGGCTKCALNLKSKLFSDSESKFIEKSNNVHKNKYDYSLVNYVNNSTKVKIICPKHGIFEQQPRSHTLNKSGCPDCVNKNVNTEKFVKKCKDKFGDLYNYEKVNYSKSNTKVIIICDNGHEFRTTPTNHLSGKGCPVCKESIGERIIRTCLTNMNINFIREKKFEGCVHKRKLKFDFFLPEYNTCIEFDGEQHFNKFRFEKNNKELNVRKKRDQIKDEFCRNNDIKLIRIKYNTPKYQIRKIIENYFNI